MDQEWLGDASTSRRAKPLYRRWWFWVILVIVVANAAQWIFDALDRRAFAPGEAFAVSYYDRQAGSTRELRVEVVSAYVEFGELVPWLSEFGFGLDTREGVQALIVNLWVSNPSDATAFEPSIGTFRAIEVSTGQEISRVRLPLDLEAAQLPEALGPGEAVPLVRAFAPLPSLSSFEVDLIFPRPGREPSKVRLGELPPAES